MLRSIRAPKRWLFLLKMFVKPVLAPRRLRPAIVLMLALTPTLLLSSVVQAQGVVSGQIPMVTYAMRISPQSSFNPFCLGQERVVDINIREVVLIAGDPNVGGVRPQGIEVNLEYDDTILQNITNENPFVFEETIFDQTFRFRALAEGQTDITFKVDIPASPSSPAVHREGTISARVLPCDYEVDVHVVWTSTMNGAGVVIIDNIQDARLQFRANYTPVINPNIRRFTMANRVRGCQGPSSNNMLGPEQMTGQLVEQPDGDKIRVTVEIYPQDASTLFTCERPFVTGIDCGALPDGTCYPSIERADFWRFETISVEVGVEGGTASIPLTLEHAGSPGQGAASITITPVRPGGTADAGTR